MDARELLIDWANGQQHWVRSVVRDVLATRQPLSDAALDAVYFDCLTERGLKEGEHPEVPDLSPPDEEVEDTAPLVLTSLGQVSNVNRLTGGQTIEFNPQLTVLFGENATGKSGYVRILKRVANVRSAEEILPDIRANSEAGPPTAILSYKVGDEADEVRWTGESGTPPFTRITIFDTQAMTFHVDSDLTYRYTPRDLALFTHVHHAINVINQRLKESRDEVKPDANPFLERFQQGSVVYTLVESLTAATNVSDLEQLADVSAEEEEGLSALRDTVDALKSGSVAARLQVAKEEKGLLDDLALAVDSFLAVDFERYANGLADVATAAARHQQANETAFDSLGIPNLLSDTWRDFVQAGDAYRKSLDDPPQGKCLYCFQDLGSAAVGLMQKYHDYCNNTLKSDLDAAHLALRTTAQPLTALQPGPLAERLSRRLASQEGDPHPPLSAAGLFLDALTPVIARAKAGQALESSACLEVATSAKAKLDPAAKEGAERVDSLTTQGKEREAQLREQSRNLRNVEDRIKLRQLLPQMRSHVEQAKWAERATAISQTFPKLLRTLTDKSKVASEDLLNQDFERLFLKESNALRAPAVQLKFPGSGGEAARRKSISADHRLSEVLSEGEQKVIALADFLAEAAIRAGSAPILFDDPVNSLDYRRLEYIVRRLHELSRSHQVIVFTHNIWFATALLAKAEEDPACCSYFNVDRDEDGRAGFITSGSHPRWDTPGKLKGRINDLIQNAAQLSGESQQAVVEKGFSLLRSWCEVVTEQELLAGVTQRYQPHVSMGRMRSIKTERLTDAMTEINEVFENACRVTDAHSQPLETLSTPPNLNRLREEWKRAQAARDAYLKK